MKKTLWLAFAGCLVAGFAYTNGTRLLASAEETVNDIPCAYSAVSAEAEEYADIVSYGATAATLLTEEEAKTKNIPEGYEDNVLVVEGGVDRGVLLDFSAYGIPTADIESITFRVYVGENGTTTDNYPEVRILQPYLKGWVMRYDISKQTDQLIWTEHCWIHWMIWPMRSTIRCSSLVIRCAAWKRSAISSETVPAF